jgi:predicted dienelactone hydrolase
MDVALEEVQRNTMPKRLGVTTLDTEESEVYRTNISALKKLHSEASTNYDKEGSNHISQYIFAVGTLINNREAVRVFVDRLRKLSIEEAKIAVSIDIHPMMNTIFDSAGADVGKFVVVNVELL